MGSAARVDNPELVAVGCDRQPNDAARLGEWNMAFNQDLFQPVETVAVTRSMADTVSCGIWLVAETP